MENIIIEAMAFSLPLFAIAIGGIYCEESGVINLALEGLLGVGAFFGGFIFSLLAPHLSSNINVVIYLTLLFAMAGGAIFSMLLGMMAIKMKGNQAISGVVLNMLAVALTAFLANQLNLSIFGAASNKFTLTVFPRITIPLISKIPILGAFFTDVYVFEIIILIVALILWDILYRTPFGMRLRACGNNPHAVAAAGLDVNRIRFKAIMISGMMAGLGGMCFAYSISNNFSPSIFAGYGYLAIAAYVFGNWKIGQTFAACLLFGFARSIGYSVIEWTGLPSSYNDIVFTLPYILTLVLLLFFSKNSRAPKNLGEIYDKGKR